MENMKWIVLGIAALMYVLVIAIQDKKVLFTLVAAAAIVILGVLFPGEIFKLPQDLVVAENVGQNRLFVLEHCLMDGVINWNILMIYLGSMLIAALFIYSKVPARIAATIIGKTPNTGLAMVLILAMAGIVSIFVENVATVLVIAPIAIAICKKLDRNPTMFMIGLAVMSNLEGTATLVGDPPSMIFAGFAKYTFNDFFVHDGKLSIFFIIQVGLLVGCILFYFIFSRNGKNKIEVEKEEVVSWLPLVLLVLMILGLAVMSFIKIRFQYANGIYVLGLGLFGLIWYIIKEKSLKSAGKLIKDLDWETIFFLIGIFIVVAAIESVGLLNDLANLLYSLTNGSKFIGFLLILLVSIIISGFVDNVPYIMAMLPVAQSMAVSMGINPELYLFALLVGSCLGGNLTPFGASANVVAMGIVKKEGYPMNFGKWIKIGVPFTLLTTVSAAAVLWLLWA
ncbi:MAG: TRAP transporter large permease subunit [Treponema sp.]|nr:TRAP transporter large permease subunit [Treponema sp.]MBQ5383348.1 TRAP transporter large permease subunit [Treponema sp.]